MMKQMKILFTFVAMLVLAFTTKAQYFEVGGIVYGITANRTAAVQPHYTLLDNPYSGAITIPQTVEYGGITYTVTALGESAFENCGAAHFEEYGDAAFWARNLTAITVDEDNPRYCSIGGWLYSKDSLALCVVPDGVAGVINVPPFVRYVGKMAFGFNSRMTSVSLPEGLVSIGDFAFNCCSVVNNVVIPSTVSSIGICPFSYCPQLTNLTIANGNTHYVMDGLLLYSSGYDTLVSCHKSGVTVTLNPNVKVLGGFENNTWVRNITIPAGVTDITHEVDRRTRFC